MSLTARLLALLLAALAPHHHRPKPKPEPMQSGLASWYDDSGTTASGAHYTYGFASLLFGSQWGRRVRFCYRGSCATGRLDDHGPYVAGRAFDLNPALKAALGCPDLCYLEWRIA
jgi:hypothetical protein